MTDRYYAGIGSRQTPDDVLAEMTTIAHILQENGYILTSGGADGADSAFEAGAGDLKRIFIPWNGFNDRHDGIIKGGSKKAAAIAEQFHPVWYKLTQGAKKLHTRNVCQILGDDLETPVEFVVCWTKDGKASGGTGTAIKIAEHYNIPVYNLKKGKFPIDKFL